MGALLDELTLGEISPPAELRERVRSLSLAPVATAPAARRLPRLRLGRPRRLVPALAGSLAVAAVIAGVIVTTRTPGQPPAAAVTGTFKTPVEAGAPVNTWRAAPPSDSAVQGHATSSVSSPQGTLGSLPAASGRSTAPLPDGQRAQDYSATLRLAVGSVADLSRSTQTVLDTVRSLGGAIETVDYGTPSAGSGSALIALRVPVARAQDALTRFSALGTITAQQVQIRDLQSGLDQETNRARALRHRIALLKAKLLSPTLSPVDRAALESRLADSQGALESVLRGVHATQQRAAFARFSLELDTGRGTAVSPPAKTGPFERTTDDALGVISVVGRGALFAAIVGGPFLLVVGGAWWLARRVRRRAARRLLETS
jgi:hypothetical protein